VAKVGRKRSVRNDHQGHLDKREQRERTNILEDSSVRKQFLEKRLDEAVKRHQLQKCRGRRQEVEVYV
jgi:hypothetical protein